MGSGVGVSPGRTVDNVRRGDVPAIVNDVGNAVRDLPGRVVSDPPVRLPGGGSGSRSPQSGSGGRLRQVPQVRLPAPSLPAPLPRVSHPPCNAAGGHPVPKTGLQVPGTGLGL